MPYTRDDFNGADDDGMRGRKNYDGDELNDGGGTDTLLFTTSSSKVSRQQRRIREARRGMLDWLDERG